MLRVLVCLVMLAALPACMETGVMPPRPAGRPEAPPQLDPEAARAAINAYRAGKSLRPLALDARLTAAAEAHVRDLARHDRISHMGSDGSNPWQRIKRTGYAPRLAAENVAAGQATLAETVQDWKDSPTHNANLLNAEATQMGIAVAYDPDTRYRTFWALELGTPR